MAETKRNPGDPPSHRRRTVGDQKPNPYQHHPNVERMLNELVDTGLYGDSRAEVEMALFLEGLRRAVMSNFSFGEPINEEG